MTSRKTALSTEAAKVKGYKLKKHTKKLMDYAEQLLAVDEPIAEVVDGMENIPVTRKTLKTNLSAEEFFYTNVKKGGAGDNTQYTRLNPRRSPRIKQRKELLSKSIASTEGSLRDRVSQTSQSCIKETVFEDAPIYDGPEDEPTEPETDRNIQSARSIRDWNSRNKKIVETHKTTQISSKSQENDDNDSVNSGLLDGGPEIPKTVVYDKTQSESNRSKTPIKKRKKKTKKKKRKFVAKLDPAPEASRKGKPEKPKKGTAYKVVMHEESNPKLPKDQAIEQKKEQKVETKTIFMESTQSVSKKKEPQVIVKPIPKPRLLSVPKPIPVEKIWTWEKPPVASDSSKKGRKTKKVTTTTETVTRASDTGFPNPSKKSSKKKKRSKPQRVKKDTSGRRVWREMPPQMDRTPLASEREKIKPKERNLEKTQSLSDTDNKIKSTGRSSKTVKTTVITEEDHATSLKSTPITELPRMDSTPKSSQRKWPSVKRHPRKILVKAKRILPRPGSILTQKIKKEWIEQVQNNRDEEQKYPEPVMGSVIIEEIINPKLDDPEESIDEEFENVYWKVLDSTQDDNRSRDSAKRLESSKSSSVIVKKTENNISNTRKPRIHLEKPTLDLTPYSSMKTRVNKVSQSAVGVHDKLTPILGVHKIIKNKPITPKTSESWWNPLTWNQAPPDHKDSTTIQEHSHNKVPESDLSRAKLPKLSVKRDFEEHKESEKITTVVETTREATAQQEAARPTQKQKPSLEQRYWEKASSPPIKLKVSKSVPKVKAKRKTTVKALPRVEEKSPKPILRKKNVSLHKKISLSDASCTTNSKSFATHLGEPKKLATQLSSKQITRIQDKTEPRRIEVIKINQKYIDSDLLANELKGAKKVDMKQSKLPVPVIRNEKPVQGKIVPIARPIDNETDEYWCKAITTKATRRCMEIAEDEYRLMIARRILREQKEAEAMFEQDYELVKFAVHLKMTQGQEAEVEEQDYKPPNHQTPDHIFINQRQINLNA